MVLDHECGKEERGAGLRKQKADMSREREECVRKSGHDSKYSQPRDVGIMLAVMDLFHCGERVVVVIVVVVISFFFFVGFWF